MIEVRNLKFIVPPILFLFLLLLVLLFYEQPQHVQQFYIKLFLESESEDNFLHQIFILIVGSGIVILALGVVIGSVTASICRVLGLSCCLPRGLEAYWSKAAKEKLKELYNFSSEEINKKESLISEICVLAEFYPEFAREWVMRRWGYFATSNNCFISAIIAWICVFIFKLNTGWLWWFLVILLLIAFLINSIWSFFDCIECDHFVLNNWEKITSRNKNDTESNTSQTDSKIT